MTPLVITPGPLTVDEVAHLALSDGQTSLDLLGDPPWGLYLVELTPPVVPRENTYALAPEGQRRIRSRPQNAVGNARVRVDRQNDDSAVFASDLDALQMMVESAHKRKGTLTFQPPNLQEIIYDIESCQITEAPADGSRMTKRMQEFVIEFECRPYGRLASETLLTDEALLGPIDGVEIPTVAGHVDALGELTITDTSSANAAFVEFGLGQQGYDPDAPLLIDSDDFDLSGSEGEQTGGAGTAIVTSLSSTTAVCCGTGYQTHGGKQKIAVLLYANAADCWVRLRYTIHASSYSYGRWVEVPSTIAETELTLATLDIGESDTRAWRGWIEAFLGTGVSATLEVSQMYVIPAEVCGRVRSTDEDFPAMWDDQAVQFTHEAAYHQRATGISFGLTPLDGDTLRVPASTAADLPSLLVVRRRLNDIDAGSVSDGRDADVTATLAITPRVALY